MPVTYFTASYGSVAMLISSISTDRGRDRTVQSPSNGDEHSVTDRGRRVVRTSAEILFCDQAGLEPYTDRYDRFLALAEGAEPQIFTHPLDGSYRASIEGITATAAGDSSSIAVSCLILRESPPTNVVPVEAGADPTSGVEAVDVAAALVDEQLAAAGLASTVPARATEMVSAWAAASDRLEPARVYLEVAGYVRELDAEAVRFELGKRLDRWLPYRAYIALRYDVTRAAEAFTSDAEQLVEIYVATARPVRAIVAELYGAADAETYVERVIKLNRIKTPARVPAGSTLKVPRPTR